MLKLIALGRAPWLGRTCRCVEIAVTVIGNDGHIASHHMSQIQPCFWFLDFATTERGKGVLVPL